MKFLTDRRRDGESWTLLTCDTNSTQELLGFGGGAVIVAYTNEDPEPDSGFKGGKFIQAIYRPLEYSRWVELEKLLTDSDWEYLHDELYSLNFASRNL